MDRCERYQSDTSHCELAGSVPAESAQLPQLPCETPHLRVRRWSRVASTTPATSQPRSSMNVPDIPIWSTTDADGPWCKASQSEAGRGGEAKGRELKRCQPMQTYTDIGVLVELCGCSKAPFPSPRSPKNDEAREIRLWLAHRLVWTVSQYTIEKRLPGLMYVSLVEREIGRAPEGMPLPPACPSAESQPSRQSSNEYSLRLTRPSHPLYSSKKPSCELSAGSTYSEMKKQPPAHSGATGVKGGCDGGGCGGDWSNPTARMDHKAAVAISRRRKLLFVRPACIPATDQQSRLSRLFSRFRTGAVRTAAVRAVCPLAAD